jgi:hypothetical protein
MTAFSAGIATKSRKMDNKELPNHSLPKKIKF